MTKDILIVGLNPALQRTITVNGLTKGGVNRGQTCEIGIGGKGQNVYVATKKSQETTVSIKLVQLLGSSFEGDCLKELLQNLASENDKETTATCESDLLTILTPGRQRTAITLVDISNNGEATEIVEPGTKVPEKSIEDLLQQLSEYCKESKFKAIAFMGSIPPGCPKEIYKSILELVADKDTKVVLDTTVLDDILQGCLNMECQFILKVNGRELCGIADVFIEATSEAERATPKKPLNEAALRIMRRYKGITIAVTDGAFDAHLFTPSVAVNDNIICEAYKLPLPKLPSEVINPIGAGDAVASGLLLSWFQAQQSPLVLKDGGNGGVVAAFSWGLACGAASCLSSKCSTFKKSLAEELYKQINGRAEYLGSF